MRASASAVNPNARSVIAAPLRRIVLTPAQAEAFVAVIGIDKILDATPTLNLEQMDRAENLPRTTRAALLRFMSSPERTEPDDLPPFDYAHVSKVLQQDPAESEKVSNALHEALRGRLHDDDAQEVVNVATKIILALQASIPRRIYKSVVNETVMPPEPYSLGRWRRQWSVAADPMIVIRDMLEGNIDPGMVSTLQQTYPELYKMVLAQLDDAIATMKTRRGDKWDLPEDKNRDVKILLGIPYLNFDLANAYAAVPPIGAEPAGKTTGPPAKPLSTGTPDDASNPEELPGQVQPTG